MIDLLYLHRLFAFARNKCHVFFNIVFIRYTEFACATQWNDSTMTDFSFVFFCILLNFQLVMIWRATYHKLSALSVNRFICVMFYINRLHMGYVSFFNLPCNFLFEKKRKERKTFDAIKRNQKITVYIKIDVRLNE